MRGRLAEILKAFRGVLANRDLRRVQLSWAASITGIWAYSVALLIFAFETAGAAGVSAVVVIQMLPSALVGPFAGLLGDRYRRERVILAADLGRAAALAAAAVAVALDAPALVVFGLAMLIAVAGTAASPARSGLVPGLANGPAELTAVNLSFSTIENVAQFTAPAAAGLIVAATSASVIFTGTAVAFFVSALLVARIRTEPTRPRPEVHRGRIGREASAGFRTIARDPGLRLVVGLTTAQALVGGTVGVLIVAAAIDLLELGSAGVGFFSSVAGLGGFAGSAVALALIGAQRLARYFGAALALFGLPLAAIGIWPEATLALVLYGIGGASTTVGEVAGWTLLQRIIDEEVLARVFSALESLFVGAMAAGALIAPLLVEAVGVRGALIAAGALLPVAAALAWVRFADLDRRAGAPTRELELLRAIPIFAPLRAAALEELAAKLTPVRAADGAELVRKGDSGDRFYILADGAVEVDLDGASRVLEGGDFFGEIALLRDEPRTATVRARGPVELYALDRADFLAAIKADPTSAQAAEAVATARLGLRPATA